MSGLKKTVMLALNCYTEKFDTKEETAANIINYVEENYITKSKVESLIKSLEEDKNEGIR